MRVLVVDDIGFNRLLVAQILEKHGYSVIQSDSGENALELLQKNPDINIVIADYMMPKMNGIELIKGVLELERHSESGIIQPPSCILLTAIQDVNVLHEAKKAGYDEILLKPVDAKRLVKVVERLRNEQQNQTDDLMTIEPSSTGSVLLQQLRTEVIEAINKPDTKRCYELKKTLEILLNTIDQSGVLYK